MSTMMTFEYLSQLCQNKEHVFSLPAEAKDVKGEEAAAAAEDHISSVALTDQKNVLVTDLNENLCISFL